MSEIKPVYQLKMGNGSWIDQERGSYEYNLKHGQEVRILYPAAAYEALQKENERLKVDLYGMKEAKKAQFNISKANQEESRKLLNEAFDDNVMKQQTIISLKYEIDGMQDLNATQAKRIAELEAATEHLGLTPKQAADGLTRYKAQVTEIESLRKQVESVKYFLLTCSSPDCVFTANTLRDLANTLLDQISASKNGE